MDKLKMHSLDVIGSNIEKIQQLFPNCVTERLGKDGKPELAIDFEKLQAELSNEIIGEGEERYQFTWPDKRAANRLANTPTTMTLRPCREESVDFDHTQNLYIEGDNLDVLKALRETYLGKVKMIYIDPPYNTGNDFVYNDDFAQSRDEFEETSGLFDDEGNQTIDPMQRNTESNGRFHTDWLNMIYPRLKVARDLLSDDGVIFISIDDNEVENLRKVCDEIFGEQNFITSIIIRANSRGQTYNQIAKTHEYILVYSKTPTAELYDLEKDMDKSDLNLKDDIGAFNIRELRNRNPKFGKHNRPGLFYPIYVNPSIIDRDGFHPISLNKDNDYCIEVFPYNSIGKESCWRWGKTKFEINCSENTFRSNVVAKEKSSGGYNIYEKYRKTTYKPKSIWDDNIFLTETGTVKLKELGFNGEFDFPKPTDLIKRCLSLSTQEDDTVLDFFSGSATTAHAVMQLNAEDGGNRKFIMVQLPEKTDEKSEAYKAGYPNICEIGKERIRRAGQKIKEENKDKEGIEKLDTGFRVLKLDSSNMEEVYYTPQEFTMQSLFSENVKADRTSEDLLFQVMLDLGIELSAKIETRQIAGKTVHLVDDNYLAACFDRDVTEAAIKEIAELHPVYFVMRDASAANDNVIDNFEQIFRHYSPDTNCKIL
ncbi:MAG TPA: site-specific DNA-methyltransferase [Candidatus Avimuribaculum pullicola]|nr:site-specific DNA-methyltransferase [Candidatus Avimuribaculum pullicola]